MTYHLAMPLSTCTTTAQKLVESSDGAAVKVFIHNPEIAQFEISFSSSGVCNGTDLF